tara:strand:+ start:12871 stop:13305 length:435 start_codon:yes stop_codon:yes gene_type:complete
MASVEGEITITRRDTSGATSDISVLQGAQTDTSNVYFITKFFDLTPWAAPEVSRETMYRLQGIVLEMQNTDPAHFQVKVGTKENVNDAETWHGPYDIVPGQLFPLNLTARYFALKIVEVVTSTEWQLSAIELLGMPTGVARRNG